MVELWKKLSSLNASGTDVVLVTLIGKRGYAPQDPGAKCLVSKEGLLWGTVGGGKVEAKCISYAQELLRSQNKAPQRLLWNLQKDVGMTCGGEVEFLFEAFFSKAWELIVFGAGHIAQELVKILSLTDARLTCVDTRQDWLDKLPQSEKLHTKLVSNYEDFVPHSPKESYFVIVTQGHASDVLVAQKIAECFPNAPYVGIIGSEIKSKKIRSEFMEKGLREDFVKKIRCPMGVFKGKNHPAEIAISISAELIQVRDSFETTSL